MKKQAQMAMWFLILVHFSLHHYPNFKHRESLYRRAGVTSYQVCGVDTELVQVPNKQVWKALATLKHDKAVESAGVSIEGTCK
jgi:diketogulonate reductase-like aldo/keto reductase